MEGSDDLSASIRFEVLHYNLINHKTRTRLINANSMLFGYMRLVMVQYITHNNILSFRHSDSWHLKFPPQLDSLVFGHFYDKCDNLLNYNEFMLVDKRKRIKH